MNYKIFSVFLFLYSFSALSAPNAELLLKTSDRSRGGLSDGLVWDLKITSISQDQNSEFSYNIIAKKNFVLAKCISPARSKDEVYLFLDKNLWIHRPGLRKPMSLSVKQKLIGQAANGDIATTNYFRDYTPKIIGEEILSGVKTWKLNLKAKSNNVTYDQINYWISQDKMLGVQAEYLTLQNKVFKKANFEYKNQVSINGKLIPFIS
ncbi:MAG: outer membrane lipoprotein-sorting protein, partial [Bdellovibrionales bacterium]|nr:outer membrane lipoprotein-sorting protein [Bdellovibrionales bacterium]